MHVDTTHTWHWLPDPGLVLTNLRVWGTSLHKIDKISYTQTQQQIISQQWLLSLSQKTFLIKFLFHERLTLWYLGLKCNITCKLCIRVFHWEPRFAEICLRTSFVSWSIQVSRWRQLYENEWLKNSDKVKNTTFVYIVKSPTTNPYNILFRLKKNMYDTLNIPLT